VPAYWPDNDTVRNDMLDYAYEVEHFDDHLGRMLAELEKRGQLDNTLVIVTSDHGMPFPRVKGNAYEMANHVPFAAMWKGKGGITAPGRTVEDHISFIDIAPTLIEVAGLNWADTGMAESPGRSLTPLFRSEKSGQIDLTRDHVLIGKERTDIGRPHDWGYPIRGIVKGGMLYLRNFEPTRWPAGNPETGYLNCDGSPTKTDILQSRTRQTPKPFWELSFGRRPAEEFFDVARDPQCMENLMSNPEYAERKASLEQQMLVELRAQEDPRLLGNGHIFDAYPYAQEEIRGYYEKYMSGKAKKAGWVNESDYEKAPLD
jgi:arylsulfatase A-like enzyme